MKFGKKWKSYRRLFREHMGPTAVKKYEEAMRKAANYLLVRLENDPGHYREHCKLSVDTLTVGLRAQRLTILLKPGRLTRFGTRLRIGGKIARSSNAPSSGRGHERRQVRSHSRQMAR